MTPTVSVIIPNYNYQRYLKDRIESVLNQTYRDFEVIILDDCSTDGSREIIETYRNHPKVSHIVYNETNSGSPFRQWEKGMELAAGKYAWIAEADDLATPDFLESLVPAMEEDSEVTLVKGMSELIDKDGNKSPHEYFEKYGPDGKTYIYDGDDFIRHYMLRSNHCYNASMMLLRIESWRELGNREYSGMRYVGDWYFWGLMMHGHRIAEVRKRVNKFRFHGNSVTDRSRQRLAEPLAETEILKEAFVRMTEGIPYGYKVFRRYKYAKYRRDKENEELVRAIDRMDPDFWNRAVIQKGHYAYHWMYKHFIWPFQRRKWDRILESGLTPLEVIDGKG